MLLSEAQLKTLEAAYRKRDGSMFRPNASKLTCKLIDGVYNQPDKPNCPINQTPPVSRC
jgi:hypothetical protein